MNMASHRRKLRYKALLDQIVSLDDSTEEVTSSGKNLETLDKTAKVVQETRNLLSDGRVEERVDNPSEGLLDSKVLLATSNMVIKCSEGVSGNVNTYDADEFADHIINNMLYWESCVIPKRIPIYSYLHGTFSPTPAERKVPKPRKRAENNKNSELKEPENVEKLDKTEKGSEMVNKLKKTLQKCYKNNNNEPIGYFPFVIDPDNFSHTVENIYNLSFLIRDGFVSLEVDDSDGLPYVKPISKNQNDNKKKSSESDNNQFIVTINMEQWTKAVKAFKIKTPMIRL